MTCVCVCVCVCVVGKGLQARLKHRHIHNGDRSMQNVVGGLKELGCKAAQHA